MSDAGASPPGRDRSHGQGAEPWLEGVLASLRYRRSLAFLRRLAAERGREVLGLDLGCGYHGRFVALAGALPAVRFRGADVRVRLDEPSLIAMDLEAPAPLDFVPDVVTMHAVIEHLPRPERVVAWVHEVLAPGGYLLATVPSRRSQPLLEFLAFRLGVISRAEIEDHERYYDRSDLEELLLPPGGPFAGLEHRYFQLGMNNWVVARKAGSPGSDPQR